MSQEMGRIERPSAEQYRGRRKLLLVPVFNAPPTEDSEAVAIAQRYWGQVETQVSALEATLGGLHHIYHENLCEGGDAGLQQLEMMGQPSLGLVRSKCSTGPTLEATESLELLTETINLQRCLMLPLISPKVAAQLGEWFSESNRSRYEYIAQQIDATLGPDQTGLLFIGERHQVQFPHDIEVFYVAPPALDEFRRWLQAWMERQQAARSAGPSPDHEDQPASSEQ